MKDNEKSQIWISRFHGRTDVYARQRIAKMEDGTEVRNFYPVCSNFWSTNCHIKTKDGKQCSECKIKAYAPVTHDSVMKHIRGDEQHGIFLLHPNEDTSKGGVACFSAADFDYKVGREQKGHTFEDVKKYTDCLDKHKLPYGIARSTNSGFHVYTFYNGPVDAAKIRAVKYEMFEQAGFMEEVRLNIRPAPEVFPKQSYAASNGFGNSIKPPMIERNWERERNCFVDSNNIMIPVEQQWEYLNSIPQASEADLDRIITECDIDVSVWTDAAQAEKRRIANGETSNAIRPMFDIEGNFVPKSNASFMKVIEGCAAMKKITTECLEGKPLGHWPGFALFHMAINTQDGYQWFMNHSGWGKDQQGVNQLKQSIAKGYTPWSCKKLQEQGVCIPGTKCLEKRPPQGVYRDGELVDDRDTPPELWPEPSPIRYGFGSGEAYLGKLLQDCDNLLLIADEIARKNEATKIINESLVFDSNQQEMIKDRLEKNKVYKKSQINKQFKTAIETKAKEEERVERSRSDVINVNGDLYRRTTAPYTYVAIKAGKNGDTSKIICSFVIDILEQKTLVEENKRATYYVGKFRTQETEIDFEISASVFDSTVEFSKKFSELCGVLWNVLKQDIDIVRSVSLACAQQNLPGKPAYKRSQYYGTQGWYGETYLMPSVAVDKDGIRPNTESPVDISKKSYTKFLDFKILGEDRFKEVLFHIKKDFFNAFPKDCSYLSLGFTLGAATRSYLGLPYKPTLWLEGESGNGKSALCANLAQFWGDFKGALVWETSYLSMLNYGAQFKDALLWVDDFKAKALGEKQVAVCKKTVQYAYDAYSARGAMSKDGTQREVIASHCNFMMNGEETPTNEVSIIARMTLLNYPKFDTTKTKEQYAQCNKMNHDYRGITPRFINYVLNRDKEELKDEFNALEKDLRLDIGAAQNPDRIVYNIAFALFHFKLFIDMMEVSGVIDKKTASDLKDESLVIAKTSRDYMVRRCLEEKNGNIFLGALCDLLSTGKVMIEGCSFGQATNYCDKIGYADPDDPNKCFLIVGATVAAVKGYVDKDVVIYSNSISAQLRTAGILIAHNGEVSLHKRFNGSASMRVWHLDLITSGLKSNIVPIKKTGATQGNLKLNEDGIA